LQKTYESWRVVARRAPYSIVVLDWYPLGSTVAKIPVDATAYVDRTSYALGFTYVAWPGDSLTTAEANEAALSIRACIISSSSGESQAAPGLPTVCEMYGTVTETDEYVRKAFGSNYARLQDVKRKYDPERVWNRWFCIQPAA